MSAGSSRLRDLLVAAREDAPSPVERARIAEKLAARIALADGGVATPPDGSHGCPGPAAPVGPPPAAGGAGVVAAGGVLLAVGIVAVLILGRPAPTSTGTELLAPTLPSPPPVGAPGPADHGDEPGPALTASSTAGEAPKEAPTSAPSTIGPRRITPPASGSSATRDRARPPVVPPAPVPRAASLAEELALLRDARAAARDDDPARSLALLDELDRRHPDGALHEERRAARVVALCASGDPSAAAEAARFLHELPSSVHAARVRAACATP